MNIQNSSYISLFLGIISGKRFLESFLKLTLHPIFLDLYMCSTVACSGHEIRVSLERI